MYCNDDEAILELLEAKKTKFNVRQDVVIDSKASFYPIRAQLAAMKNAALTGGGMYGHGRGLAGLAGLGF